LTISIRVGDALATLRALRHESVHCVVTSPPYFGLRDYGVAGQIGLEPTPEAYVDGLVAVFREVRRVLRADGTLWLNIGDSYAGSWGARGRGPQTNAPRPDLVAKYGTSTFRPGNPNKNHGNSNRDGLGAVRGCKSKDLIGIPWMLAFALRADGWYLRRDIIWHKPNPMPESVTDRPTSAHEYLFLLTKSARYFYDSEAIKEPAADSVITRSKYKVGGSKSPIERRDGGRAQERSYGDYVKGRNKRSVWTIATAPFRGAHFATFPPVLIEPCILAGCPKGGTVLDPFLGAGTTALVADRLGRNCIGIELNPAYAEMARQRIGLSCAAAA
jgi:DNA modification methylase